MESMDHQFIWLNEDLIPATEARVSVNDRGLLFGDGLFETLRAEAGRVLFLPEHLARLQASARVFRLQFPAWVPWEDRLAQLLKANGLIRGPAYTPPTPEEYAVGWPVVVFPEGRSTFVGRHKSLSYLFYLAARQYALDEGAKEALILEADGLVSEGAATSLVYLHQRHFCIPKSASALPGVTVAVLRRGLAARDLTLDARPTTVAQLHEAGGLWLANALMGLMPVAAINGMPVLLSEATAFLQEVLATMAARI
jgi:branched-chain amino acid aminotransferase